MTGSGGLDHRAGKANRRYGYGMQKRLVRRAGIEAQLLYTSTVLALPAFVSSMVPYRLIYLPPIVLFVQVWPGTFEHIELRIDDFRERAVFRDLIPMSQVAALQLVENRAGWNAVERSYNAVQSRRSDAVKYHTFMISSNALPRKAGSHELAGEWAGQAFPDYKFKRSPATGKYSPTSDYPPKLRAGSGAAMTGPAYICANAQTWFSIHT